MAARQFHIIGAKKKSQQILYLSHAIDCGPNALIDLGFSGALIRWG
jgi:hypothetical protein